MAAAAAASRRKARARARLRPAPQDAPAGEERLRAVARSHNLTPASYAHIERVLGRRPTLTEVGIFGVMYSEHCSYGSSRPYLKTFPTAGPRVLVGAGEENAGVIDLGDGWHAVFKCESHNHPSAVEPYQGAATGVGGIVRDIFTMGARPVALLDSLRFGPLSDGRTRYLLDGVVRGIAGYGNCIGVPTVGGEIAFDDCYRGNPLVNVMCVGLLREGALARASAKGAGNPVLYVGSSTGRDGLGGASFASRELTEGSDADRPAVQIGDPFAEKCLIEATLEALGTGDVVGIQDMGAAGLTCSTCETASRGGCGIEIDVAKVPVREAGITPYEIMLSESQERMLLIVRRGTPSRVIKLFAKWGLNAVEIGRVTGGDRMRVFDGARLVADIPVRALTDEAPVYRRPTRRPRDLARLQRLPLARVRAPRDWTEALLRLLGAPSIASKAAVYEQYDHMVQTNTVVAPGAGDAAVLRIKGTRKFLAATLDGNGRHCRLDPYEGSKGVVAEAARNLACTGAVPLAVTDCLNFGSPEDPEIMWQFKEAVRGLADACRAFGTPVTGGNVSFYNERGGRAIDPTPVVGMIGLLEPARGSNGASHEVAPLGAGFKAAGDVVLMFGRTRQELGGSAYLAELHGLKAGRPPRIDLKAERALQRFLSAACRGRALRSAHDCSDGGLAVALAECCLMGGRSAIGAVIAGERLKAGARGARLDAVLFGESAGRVVGTCAPADAEAVRRLAAQHGVPAEVIGTVGGRRLQISPWVDAALESLRDAWRLPDWGRSS
ncbi:MAG TPA: phosphoribosylformylglycinamidine synthase subunit PurL [bacterium]